MSAQAQITGNLGRPVELRFTPGGRSVASFSVADTPRRKNPQTNEWEDAGETLWVDVSLWGSEGEALAERAHDYRGRVAVTGRLGIRSYEAKDGTQRQSVTLTAETVALLPKDDERRVTGNSNPHAAAMNQARADAGDPWAGQPRQQTWGGAGNDDSPPF